MIQIRILFKVCILLALTPCSLAYVTVGQWQPLFQGVDYATAESDEPRVQQVSAVRVDLDETNLSLFSTPSNGGLPQETTLQTASTCISTYGVQVCVNANFYSTSGGYADLWGLGISEGTIVSNAQSGTFSTQLCFTAAKVASLMAGDTNPTGIHTAVGGAEIILENGVNIGVNPDVQPRTVMGLSRHRRYLIIVVVDGRQPGYSEGVNHHEAAQWLQRFGAWDGCIFDGGGSSHLWVSEYGGSTYPLNSPSENRAVGNHLGVYADAYIPPPPSPYPPAPYGVDANTLHLYHLDGSLQDQVETNPIDLVLFDGATVTDDSEDGYGIALNTYDGVAGNGPMAGAENPETLTISDFVGTYGAFTFEAIIRPFVNLGNQPNHMQIVCGEGNSSRGWQFRINTGNQLQFYNLTRISSGGWDNVADVPTTGDHAYEVGSWYHVAVTYNGMENTPDNLKFYWTKLDSGATEAQFLASFTMEYDLTPNNPARFSIGNEYREPDHVENFEGLIDEVRISSIAREPADMLYYIQPNILHYYQFEGDGQDSAVYPLDLNLANGATATQPSAPDYGTALNTYDGASGMGPYAGAVSNPVPLSAFVGTDGAFTFEALIKPALPLASYPNHMQIICGDNSTNVAGNETRGWHFRINNTGEFQFTKITGEIEDFTVAVPQAGVHAYEVDAWYHVAVTYNGMENTADNLKLYWTKLDSEVPQASLLAAFTMNADLNESVQTYFAVGNELRGDPTENFDGLIDEVRISKFARTAGEMLYTLDDTPPTVVQHPQDITAREPETVAFETLFTSETTAQVLWYKIAAPADIQLQQTDPGVSIELVYDANTEMYTSTLTLEECGFPDSGEYYAELTNISTEAVYSDVASLWIQGLRSHWTLNESDYTGTHYLDLVSGYDAWVEPIPAFVPGADGTTDGAVYLTSSSGWASLAGMDPAIFTDQFTISYWTNWQEQSVATADLQIDSEMGTVLSIPEGLTADQNWQHLCAVFDGNSIEVYIDGLFLAQSQWVLPDNMVSDIYIGSNEAGTQVFDGLLDDIRIYNYALSDIEVAQLRYDFAGLRSCVYEYADYCDWTGPEDQADCEVDIYDLRKMLSQYLTSDVTYDLSGPTGAPDGIVNLYDLWICFTVWLDCGLYPDCP